MDPHGSPELFQILQRLSTEARNPRTAGIDLASTEEVLRLLHAEDRTVADRVQEALPKLVPIVDHVVAAFHRGGRLIYVGAGTSGRLGVLDAAECPPTYSTPPGQVMGLLAGGYETLVRSREGVEDRAEDGARDIDHVTAGPDDVVVGISASQRTPYVRGALARARERGAWTAFVVCNLLADDAGTLADHVVEVITGPEPVAGSTRMKAALAQKMMLTMVSTASMIRSGKVFENLMVDVAPTSAKLRERAKGLVMHLGQVDYAQAERLLVATGWRVKHAVLVARSGVTVDEAERRLESAQGRLRQALNE